MKINSNRESVISSQFLNSRKSWDQAMNLIDHNIKKFSKILSDFKVEKNLKNNQINKNKVLDVNNNIHFSNNPKFQRKINDSNYSKNDTNKSDFFINVSKNEIRETQPKNCHFYNSEKILHPSIQIEKLKKEKSEKNKNVFIPDNVKNINSGPLINDDSQNNLIINNEIVKNIKMENLLNRLRKNTNYNSNNGSKSFFNLISSKNDLKNSKFLSNQSPIKRIPRLNTDLDQVEDDEDVLNTTNDKIKEGPEYKFELSKEKIAGSLICKNRIIEPIVSLKNENINENGKYGKLSKFLLQNNKNESKNKSNFSKSPINNLGKYKDFGNNKNNYKPVNGNFYSSYNGKEINNKLDKSFNDSRLKYPIQITGDYSKNRFTTNNANMKLNNSVVDKSNYYSSTFDDKRYNKLLNIPKTGIDFPSSDPLKKLNNTRISEDDEKEFTCRNKEPTNRNEIYYTNQDNFGSNFNNNFIHQNNNKYIKIVNEINTKNVNFISQPEPNRKESNNEDCKIPVKENGKIFGNPRLEFSKPISKIGEKNYKTPEVPLLKDKNFKNIGSTKNFTANWPVKDQELNSSMNKKSPLYTSEGLYNFVNKAKMTVGVNKNENDFENFNKDNDSLYNSAKLKGLYESNKISNEAFIDFNSNEKDLDNSRYYEGAKAIEFRKGNFSDKNNSEKINLIENEMPRAFKLADSIKFSKANYTSNFNNSCKEAEKPGFLNFDKHSNKISFPNSSNILNHMAKREEKNLPDNRLSKITIDIDALNSTFANDIDYIIANQRQKNSLVKRDNNPNSHGVPQVKDRKKSSLINNNETKSNTGSLNSEGIISEKKLAEDKDDELVLCCASNKIDYLKANFQNSDEIKKNDNIQKRPNNNFSIEKTSIDIISKIDFKADDPKIKRIQSLFRGVLLRKIFKKCYGNYESLTKLMSLFDELLKARQIKNKKKLFKNMKIIREESKLQACTKFINSIKDLFDKKLNSFKNNSFRKIYLFSFTKKISKDLEKKQSREVNKSLEKQKSQFLLLQKEKENHKRDLKFLSLLTNFVNRKTLTIKSSLIKQLKEISSELKLAEEKRLFIIKKLITFLERRYQLKNSREYLNFYQKGLFVHWKNLSQKSGLFDKIKRFMLENIFNKKNKILHDEKVLLTLIEKRSKGESIKLDKDNNYYGLIKDSYTKMLLYFNNFYLARVDSENKSNKLMFILQKLIYNKQNIEIKLLKKNLIKLKIISNAIRLEIKSKRDRILFNLIQFKSQNFCMAISSKLNQWRTKASKMTKKNNMLLNLLLVKFSKNYISTKRFFKSYRYKARQISSQTKKINHLVNVANFIDNRIKSEVYQQLIKKLKGSVKWNRESQDMKIVTINCSMTRETLEKNINLIDGHNELLNDNSIQDFLIEKNFRFKTINYLWKLSTKEKFILRYYLLRLFNRVNLILVKELKKSSFKWSSNTYYKGHKRNYTNNRFIEKEEPILTKPPEELNESNNNEKARNCFDTEANEQSRMEGPLNQSYSRVSTIEPIRRQESGINSELIIQKYKNDLIKTLGIETLSTQNVSFELDKKWEGFKKDKLLLSTQNMDSSITEDKSLSKIDNLKLEIEDNKEDLLSDKREKAMIILMKVFVFKKQQTFFGLLRCLKFKTLQSSAKLITQNLKNFYERSRKLNLSKPGELGSNNEAGNNLIKNNNSMMKPPKNLNFALDDITSYKNQKVNESSIHDLDDSGYSESVIDLVRVVQLYIYDKANPINKYNYPLRVFNKWRNITNKLKTENIVESSGNPIKKNVEALTDISPILSERASKFNTERDTNEIQNQDISNQEEGLMLCMSASRPQKKNNSIGIYANYINSLSKKIENFMEGIQRFCLIGFINFIQQKPKSKRTTFSEENEEFAYTIDNIYQVNQKEKTLRDSTKNLSDGEINSKLKNNKKQFSIVKNLIKLEVFSFDVNLSASTNYNWRPSTFRNPSHIFTEDRNLNNHSMNIQINRSTNNIDINNYLKKNTNNNQSFSQNPYLNTGNNHSVVYSRNMTFNSELRSDEEPEEINEVRISCAIEIQNFWREYRIQKYLLNYSNKLKLLDRFIKKKNLKLKNFVFISYSQWKKKLLMTKIYKAVKILQKFYRKRISKQQIRK